MTAQELEVQGCKDNCGSQVSERNVILVRVSLLIAFGPITQGQKIGSASYKGFSS